MNFDLRENIIEKCLFKYVQVPGAISNYHIILAQLSTYFNNSIIVDMGTHKGYSAVALAHNKTNTVYTYDIKHHAEATDLFKKEEFKNIEYIIGDCIESDWEGMPIWDTNSETWPTPYHVGGQPKSDKEIFLSSELIFLDIDPHDGIQEDKVLNFLISNNWKGIMVCDDIVGGANAHETGGVSLSATQMQNFWNNIGLSKYNISTHKYAGISGTGIVCFDNQEIVI